MATKSSNHWYDVSGAEIVSAHDADLRQARKRNLFISPTSVEKGIRANPMLARWLEKETVKACDANPRFANEDLDAYAGRINKLSGSIGENAADLGTRIHAVLEEYPKPAADQSLQPWLDCFDGFFRENFSRTLHAEIRLADFDLGVAGTCDFVGLNHEGRTVINDYKTKRKTTGDVFYPSFARQLAFYSVAYQKKHGLSERPICMSTVIDSTEPKAPIFKIWSEEEIDIAYTEFQCQVWLWCADKKYWPTGTKWKLNYSL
jgi:hypothetical protein